MQSGKLRHRITIQHFTVVQDEETGIVTEEWSAFAADIPAEIRPLSGREFIEAGIRGSKVMTWITIRYLAGIKTSMRIIHGERIYNIESAALTDPKTGVEYIRLPCSEVISG